MAKFIKDKEESTSNLVWDKKRVLASFLIAALIIAAAYFVKVFVLPKKEVKPPSQTGKVAGLETNGEKPITFPSKEEFVRQVETVKREIYQLKPEDLTSQEPVQKIIIQLEDLKASAEAQIVGGAKDTVCNQAKKIFCSQ